MQDTILNLIKTIISLDHWKFVHLRVGTKNGTAEFFYPNPIQPEETNEEKQEKFLKENPNGLIVGDEGIKVD